MEHACLASTTNLHEEGLHNSECNRMKNMQFSFFKKWVGIVCFLFAFLLSSSLFAVDKLYVSGITGTHATANGEYSYNGDKYGYNSWIYTNGSNTYYICHDNEGYWDFCTNIEDPINSFIYTSQDQSFIASPTGISNWCNNSALETLECNLPISVKSSQPEINVLGNANTITDGSVSPSFSNYTKFGAVNYSSGTVTRTFTISNTGLTPLSISGVTITGTNYGDFTITTSPASSIAASGSTTLVVQFDPSAIGSRTATVSITNNDSDEGTYDFTIQGDGYTPSNLVVYNISTPSAANGIYTHQGALSGQYEYWMHSSGSYYIYRKAPDGLNYKWIIDSDTDVSTYLFTDYGISDYSPITDSWIASIGTGSPNVVSYVASPEIVVLGNATSISNNDATPRTADHTHFGTAEVGSGSVTRAFTIQNAGGTILQLSGSSPYIALSGSNASDFTVTTLPTTPMTAGNSTTFQITFTPLGEGAKTATVSIANNDSDENPFTFSIQGGGVYAKGLTVSGTSTVDGDYTYQGINADGFASWVHTSGTYRIYNSQYVPLDRRDWRIDTDTDPDNGVCFASPDFNTDPAPIGITPSSWAVGIGSIGNPVVVYYASEINIQGNGNSIANGDVTPITTDYTDFGSVLTSSGSVSHSFTIQNTGKGSLYLTGSPKVAISGTNASDFTVTTQPTSPLSATTGTTTFTVLFDPSAIGVRTATISIVNDDSPYTFSIQGTGLSAPTVTTQAVSSIATTTATGNGNITNLGNSNPTSYGFCYGTTANPDVTGSKVDKGTASATGAFVAQLTGLNPGVTYHARAFATNSVETVYGADMTFTTSETAATTTTAAASGITPTAATLNGTVNANNSSCTVSFAYGLTSSYGLMATATPSTATGTGNTSVSATLSGLTPNTTYHYILVTSKSATGTVFGSDMTFTTAALPVVLSVSVPFNGSYKAGDVLSFTVNMSKAVTVTGTPALSLTVGGATRSASYVSGSSTATALVFSYTVASGDLDANGIAVGMLSLNGGTITDAYSNAASLALNSVGATASVLVDAVAPVIASVNQPANGYYKSGDVLSFVVNYSEVVILNVAGQTPFIKMDIGGNARDAVYKSGAGTSALVFQYTVVVADDDNNGILLVTPSIVLNGATIRDGVGNDAAYVFIAGDYSGILVDNIPPAIGGVANGQSYTSAQSVTFTEGTATLSLNGGMAAAYLSGTPISASGNYVATVTDAAGNNNSVSFTITISTGINEQHEISLSLYPNPCTDGFKVSGIDAPANVIITDLTGRVVVTTMVEVDGDVAVSHLKQGTYLVKVNQRVLKLIKK